MCKGKLDTSQKIENKTIITKGEDMEKKRSYGKDRHRKTDRNRHT